MNANRGKRILHVPRRFALDEWGGTETVVTQLCREQLSAGWQPEIHTSLALAKLPRESFEGVSIFRYRYCYPFFGLCKADVRALDKKGGNLLSLDLFLGLLRAKGVRLFHAHVTKRMGASVMKAAKIRKLPCVVTLHGNHFDVPQAEAGDVVAPQQGKFEWGRPFGMLFGSRTLLEDADAVLCVGKSECDAAKAALPHDRVHFLPNGVNVEAFRVSPEAVLKRRRELGYDERHFVFGCISRIDAQKDQKLLLNAFARLHARHPEARLLLCGPVTSESYLAELRRVMGETRLGDVVHIVPAVKAGTPEHAATFAALDCFVLPSRHEPFGIVVLEAWASQKPVITSSAGGLEALVSHETTGLKFRSGNADELLACMNRVLSEPGLGAGLADGGFRQARDVYAWSAVARQLESIYQQAEVRHESLAR